MLPSLITQCFLKCRGPAVNLIECLIHKGDYYDAERFAQVTLDSLKDPANGVDQDSLEMAKGYYTLGNAMLYQNGDLNKAERLARESYRIYVQLYGNDHICVSLSCNLLAGTLMLQGKLGDETKELLQRSLAIGMKDWMGTILLLEMPTYVTFMSV